MRMVAPAGLAQMSPAMRSPTPAGSPIFLPQRIGINGFTPTSTASQLLNGGPPPLVSPSEAGLIYPYEYQYATLPHLLEYPTLADQSCGTSFQVR